MSDIVETTEPREPLFKQGWIYLPGGSICNSFDEAVFRMYDQGYSLAAMKHWFGRYEAGYGDISQALINQHIYVRPGAFGDMRIREGDFDWLDQKLYGMYGVEKSPARTIDLGVISPEEETIMAEEAGLIVPEQTGPAHGEPRSRVEQLIEDPLPVFKQMNTYTTMVAQGLERALLITGQGGVGKSYNVTRILSAYGKKGKDYVVMKGKSTVAAMYKFLYDNYDKIVVFDDCDSILQNTDGLNVLKGVLDTADVREVSWNNSRAVNTFGLETHEEIEKALDKYAREHKKIKADLIPNFFRFMGACIFISNYSEEDFMRNAAMAPLLSRCSRVNIQLTHEEVILKMEAALPSMHIYNTRGEDITREELKREVFEYISSPEFLQDPRIADKPISFRLFNKSYLFRYAGLPNWKELSFCI